MEVYYFYVNYWVRVGYAMENSQEITKYEQSVTTRQ